MPADIVRHSVHKVPLGFYAMYAMTDPFNTIMLIINHGNDYAVWDEPACNDCKKLGRDAAHAGFRFSEAEIYNVKHQADKLGHFEFDKYIEMYDPDGEVVVMANRTYYVRRYSYLKSN